MAFDKLFAYRERERERERETKSERERGEKVKRNCTTKDRREKWRRKKNKEVERKLPWDPCSLLVATSGVAKCVKVITWSCIDLPVLHYIV